MMLCTMVPVPGVSGPSQVAEALCSMLQKSFPFFNLNQTLFPFLEESCSIYLEEILSFCIKEGLKRSKLMKPKVRL